ncbi:hypothetical protein PC9H_000845 [Pleurotus ostreatus]|uniref:Uncharacterized protein n=2 Tax=Pleurotus ostreatus TaxID=5322 RepID=A0A067NYZ8_PLEO1|nr:uncharacterized protein PC9H_000845 [Pleurotus ostreatus]KAF7440500.1 hypothetical protein PC9H_000845 [Pleurotus ostreatus]KAJ8700145.1 hypothetical protein PTI98_003200 [Pleurotus ostreatus]KDQ33293.1 hypothetical protein PLEOSDRAFT_1110502 [Pleurotus ostreatus PC15]
MAPHFDSTKVDLKPRRHHGYAVVLFIFGTLFPPLAVAARFGIGKDFWLNLLLTICGYIPGHGHNFYIQNIRNNKNHARTPKWAQRYGLVDTSEIKRKERKSQWANRYNDRLPESTYEGQPLEEGEVAGSSTSLPADAQRQSGKKQANGDLWRPEDESYYNAEQDNNSTRSSGRWHFPANFDDAIADEPIKKNKKKKKDKKDRWARTEDAYSLSEQTSKRKKSKKKRSSAVGDGAASTYSNSSTTEFPEDPEGGLYAPRPDRAKDTTSPKENGQATDDTLFTHQF